MTFAPGKRNLTVLSYVYPPVSYQEAEWVKGDSEVKARIRASDLYMIAARAEAHFENFDVDEDGPRLQFDFRIGDEFTDHVVIRVGELPGYMADDGDVVFELGPKLIRIWDEPEKGERSLLAWYSTEKIIVDRSRGVPGVEGFDDFRSAARYDLLYVGIAKVRDAFDRVLRDAHKALQTILGNERQRRPGSRVSDEVYLFFFRLDPLVIQTFDLASDGLRFVEAGPDPKALTADAEKAFVRLLDPRYNEVKYVGYPHGADGMYGSEYLRYGYVIAEDVVFATSSATITGAGRGPEAGPGNGADGIFVDGEEVTLLRGDPDYGSRGRG